MKIAVLSDSDVAGWYAATIMERGHEIQFGLAMHLRQCGA